jgi:hypothetical protein
MLAAEKRCCKSKDITMWTPEMYQSMLVMHYFNLLKKKPQYQRFLNHCLSCITSRMTITTKSRMDSYTGSVREKLNLANSHHSKLVMENYKSREAYLNQLIEDLEERDPRAKQSIKNILHRERVKNDFRVICKVLKGNKGAGIKHIEVQDIRAPTIWRAITNPAVI